MNYDHRYLAERLAHNLLGDKYHHSADFFGDKEYMKKTLIKCIQRIRKFVAGLECHEQLRFSINTNLDRLETSLSDIKTIEGYFPTIYALSAIWNLLGGLGHIRHWTPEYTQDLDQFLGQKEFLEKGDMIMDSIKLRETAYTEQVRLILELRKKNRSTIEISQIMNLPEGRIRKILRELK